MDFLVIGNVDVPNVGPLIFSSNGLQNGPDAVALYNGPTAIAFIDGSQTEPTTTDLVDAVAYDDGDLTDDIAGLLGLSSFVSEGAAGDATTASVQRFPDGTGEFSTALATPGATNFVPDPVEITITLSASTIAESSTGEITATLTRTLTDGDLDVTVFLDDESEAELVDGDTVTLLDGQATLDITINAIDDTFPDGDQTVTLTANPDGLGQTRIESFLVTDDASDTFTIVFNEVSSIAQEDLNGDGLIDGNDDFVEVLNVSSSPVDLTFFEIREGTTDDVVHVFPEGAILEPGCSIIVGSQNFVPGAEVGRFGTAPVQNASEGNTLRITDTGDTMRLIDFDFREAYSVTIPDLTGTAAQGSWALTTDGDATSGYAQHADIGAASGALSSPGTELDGDPFCVLTSPVTVSFAPSQVLENAGSGSVTATVSIPSAQGEDLAVFVFSTDLSGISSSGGPLAEGVIEAGSLSVDISLDAVDDDVTDGNQTVTLVAGGLAFLNATASVEVLDDGLDPSPLQVCDIAFVAYAADTPDAFAFVALTDIDGNTEISFTDNGWISDAAGFRTGEGIVTWTAPPEGVPALTVITITNNSPYDAASSAGPNSGGSVVEIAGGGPNISAGGDQIFAYQGSFDAPVFLAAIQAFGPFLDAGSELNSNSSTLPGALAVGGTLVIDPVLDNAAYIGSTTAVDVAAFKALLSDPANFASGDARDDVSFPSNSFVFGVPSDFTVAISDCDFTAGQFVVNFTATGASDVYVSTDLQSFTLATNGAGVASGTFTDTAPPGERAFYLIQEAGSPAP